MRRVIGGMSAARAAGRIGCAVVAAVMALGAWSVALGAGAGEGGKVQIAPVALREEMWQELPAEVVDVYVGPDGRVWYVLAAAEPVTLEELKGSIAAAFASPAPARVIRGAWIALFQEGREGGERGRVWFASNRVRAEEEGGDARPGAAKTRSFLLGYDGQTWVEHGVDSPLFADAPGHSDRIERSVNGQLEGAALFPVRGSVHVFAEGQWREEAIAPADELPPADEDWHISFWPEPDGKGLVVHTPGGMHALWRWRAGQLRAMASPAAAYGRGGVAPVAEGVWVRTDWGMRLVRYDEPAVNLEDQVQRLLSPILAERESAGAMLVDGRGRAQERLHRILSRPANADARDALGRLVRPDSVPPVQFGSQAVYVSVLASDGLGRTFVMGSEPGGQPWRPMLLMQDRDGMVLRLRDEGAREIAPAQIGAPAVVPAGGGAVWVPTREPMLIDTQKGRIVRSLPWGGYRLCAAKGAGPGDAEGVVFCRAGTRLYAYRPGMPDTRMALASRVVVEPAMDVAAGADGTIYIVGGRVEPVRLENEQPRSVARPERATMVQRICVGRGAALLRWMEGWSLEAEGVKPEVMPLRRLLKRERKRMVEAFQGAGESLWTRQYEAMIAVDRAGNIWLSEPPDCRLAVLVEEEWIEGAAAMERQGLPQARVTGMLPMGDGVLLQGTSVGWPATGVWRGTVREGELVISAVAGIAKASSNAPMVPDRRGGAFVQVESAWREGVWARVTEDGVVVLPAGKVPLMADGFENVVLQGAHGRPGVTLVTPRGQPQELTAAPLVGGGVFEMENGVLYVWLPQGLQEFRRDAEGGYVAGRCFDPKVVQPLVESARHVPGKGIYVIGRASPTANVAALWRVEVPGEKR